MQIKRHWLLVETMPFEYFFSGVVVYSGCGAFLRLEESRHMDFSDVVCQMAPHPIRYNECDPSSVHRYNPQQHDIGTLRGPFFYTQVHVRTTQDT